MGKSVDQYITELVTVFHTRNPEVGLEVSFRDGVYYFTVDLAFKFLPEALQYKARKDIHIMLSALAPLRLQTELRLGDV